MESFIKESIYYFELILFYLGYYLTMKYRFDKDSKLVRIARGALVVTIIYVSERFFQWLSNTVFGQPYLSIPLQFALAFGITFWLFDGDLGRRIWAYMLYILPGTLGEILLLPVMLNVLAKNPLYDIGTHLDLYNTPGLYSICMLLIGQTIVFIWLFLLIMTKCWIRKEYPPVFSLFMIFPAFEIIMLVMFYENVNNLDMRIIVEGYLFFVFGVITDAVIVYMIIKVVERRLLEQKLEINEQQRQLESAYNNLVVSNVKEIRNIKHDINNRIQVIYSAINDANMKKANELLDETNAELAKLGIAQYCDNYIVNSILTLKKDEAVKQNIDLNIECFVTNDIDISSIDLCSVYTNVLDNAIEGAVKTERPWIKFSSKIEKGYLIIQSANSCNTKDIRNNGIGQTSKEDKYNHGIGLKQIEKIAISHNGKIDINYENDSFEIVIIMEVR